LVGLAVFVVEALGDTVDVMNEVSDADAEFELGAVFVTTVLVGRVDADAEELTEEDDVILGVPVGVPVGVSVPVGSAGAG
jgi:hypothetical protein